MPDENDDFGLADFVNANLSNGYLRFLRLQQHHFDFMKKTAEEI